MNGLTIHGEGIEPASALKKNLKVAEGISRNSDIRIFRIEKADLRQSVSGCVTFRFRFAGQLQDQEKKQGSE